MPCQSVKLQPDRVCHCVEELNAPLRLPCPALLLQAQRLNAQIYIRPMFTRLSELIARAFTATCKTFRIALLLLFLGFFVASHTVTALAAITSTAISAIAGTASTVLNRSKAKNRDLSANNTKLRADLDRERHLASRHSAENRRLHKATTLTFRGQTMTGKQATQGVINRTMIRTKRSILTNVASIPGESIPCFGIGIVVAATTYEFKAACTNMTDLYELQVALDPNKARSEDRSAVCALQIPTKEEVWSRIKESPNDVWEGSIAALANVADEVKKIEPPDFGGTWHHFTTWMGGRL